MYELDDNRYISQKKKDAPNDVHVMNKDEAKLMRKLKNETGMTEKEIRQHKKYRVMLSTEQKKGQKAKRTKVQKARDDTMKATIRKLQLSKKHTDINKAYVEEWNRRKDSRFYGYIYSAYSPWKNHNNRTI